MTIQNRIQDDAVYRHSYPNMKGSGEMPAVHELHIFLQDLNPTSSQVERYYAVVNEWNARHPDVTDKMKACYLALVFRASDGKEQTISVMQSARYFRSNSTDDVVKAVHEDADWFAAKGFSVIREKIEASAYGIMGIPQTEDAMQSYPTKYFEFHIKIGRKDVDKSDLLTDGEISELKQVSERFTKRFKTPIPLSYNKNPDQLHRDGQGHQRFLNVRFRGKGLENVRECVKEIEKAINETRTFKVLKTISEYVWYDSFTQLDHGWIDYTQEELAVRLHGLALPKIVAFLGPKHVGKDTAADYLVRCHGYVKYGLADPMKKALQHLFKLSNEQLWGKEKELVDPFWGVTPRELMQFIGIDTLYDNLGERFPQIGKSFVMRNFTRWMEANPEKKIVISDLRIQEDVNTLKKMGALIVRLERPALSAQDPHSSESGVEVVHGYDRVIVNDSTIALLEQKVEKEVTGNA